MSIFETIRVWAKRIKRDPVMLWFARQHPDTPFLVKALCFFTVTYALSPIDLIPDFIPVLGYIGFNFQRPFFPHGSIVTDKTSALTADMRTYGLVCKDIQQFFIWYILWSREKEDCPRYQSIKARRQAFTPF